MSMNDALGLGIVLIAVLGIVGAMLMMGVG